MTKKRILLIGSLLAFAALARGGQDRGELSLAACREQRSKVFSDGRSIVAYRQSGTMVGGDANGPWKKATLFAQGTIFKDPGGTVIADVALWETTDPEGDLVWGVLWQPKDAPHALEIKAGSGKWKGISGKGKLLNGGARWEIEWSIDNLESAALRCKPSDYAYHDSGFSFHGPHVTEMSRKLPNGATLIYNNQSGVLLSDNREARSPRNLATSYDRGTTYSIGDKNLADIMLLEDTDPDGDTVWLYHEWWYGKGPGSYEFIGGTGKWKGISGYGKTLGVLRDRVDDHWLLKSEMHWNLKSNGAGPIPSALAEQKTADLVLMGGEVYTMEPDHPWASAVVITGNRITAVIDASESIKPFVDPRTRVIDLKGGFVLPGFIDAHVHFDQAGNLINGANLMKVSDREGLQAEMRRVTAILETGEWITGGLWGAYEQWAEGASRAQGKKTKAWEPDRSMIDDITARHPCLLNNFDGTLFLANTAALQAADLEQAALPGMVLDVQGRPTGLIRQGSPALVKLRDRIKPKSPARLLDENRAALKALREAGIVEIHDIATPDQTERLITLQDNGELTCRVWLRPDLSRAPELKEKGFTMGLHPKTRRPDSWLRYGALKGYIDGIMGDHGALFFAQYTDQPSNFGHYRRHTSDDPDYRTPNMDKLYSLIRTGYDAGFVANVHAIGDKGVSLMLDTYERLMKDIGHDLEGFRIIHAQVVRPEDFPRFKKLNVIAEVNPYHLSDDMRWMEERIGHERCRGAYAFRTLLDSGAILSFGSDWPGTQAAEYTMNPRYLIHAAVNRTTVKGTPEGGWFPEQKILMHEALKAYTINNAYAAMEADSRGSIKPGKLADLTVCDLNLMKIDPREVLRMNIMMTVVDGKVVYERESFRKR